MTCVKIITSCFLSSLSMSLRLTRSSCNCCGNLLILWVFFLTCHRPEKIDAQNYIQRSTLDYYNHI